MAESAKEKKKAGEKGLVKRRKKVQAKNILAEEESAYLTKRTTARAARTAFIQAAKETIDVMGFNVVAKDGWVVKVTGDGKIIERISKVPNYNKKAKTRLD